MKKINIIAFDADKFDQDLIKVINKSNILLISKSIVHDITKEIIKTAINQTKFDL